MTITQGQLNAEIAANLPTNGLGQITAAILRTTLTDMVSATFQPNQTITLTGDVTGTGTSSIATTVSSGVITGGKIGTNTVTNSNLAQAPANTVKGNPAGITANVQDTTNPAVLGIALTPASSSTNQGLTITQSASGSQTGGISTPINDNIYGLNLIQVTSDNVARPSVGSNKFSPFAIVHDFGGSSTIGGRNGIDVTVIQTATTSASNNDRNYQAGNFEIYSNKNDGGTNTGAGAAGALFSLGGAAILDSGATNWLNLTFMEANIAAVGTATLHYKSLIQLASLPQDAVQGAVYDTMIGLSNQTGAVGWNTGILFGPMNGQAPIKSTGTLIATTGSATAAIGLDFSSYTFTGNAIHTPGFAVSNTGLITGLTSLTLDGATSGQTTLSVTNTGGAATISSGQTSAVTTFTVSDGVSGSSVSSVVANTSASNSSTSVFQVKTGVSNAYVQLVELNNAGTPTATLQWGTGTSNLTLNNTTNGNIATWTTGLQLGTPTGGDKGIGTLNAAAGIFTNTSLTAGVAGIASGNLVLQGSTSGSSTLSVSANGGSLNISSGQTTNVTTLAVTDTVAGGEVGYEVVNNSAANSSTANMFVGTGVANAWVQFVTANNTGSPSGAIEWGSAVRTGSGLLFYNSSLTMTAFNSGIQVYSSTGPPTGGDLGYGSINIAGSIFQNNSAYTHPDFVFEKEFTGNVTLYISPRAEGYEGRLPLDDLRAHVEKHLRLPRITDEPAGLGMRSDIALEKIEELTLYVLDLHDRIKTLEVYDG